MCVCLFQAPRGSELLLQKFGIFHAQACFVLLLYDLEVHIVTGFYMLSVLKMEL